LPCRPIASTTRSASTVSPLAVSSAKPSGLARIALTTAP